MHAKTKSSPVTVAVKAIIMEYAPCRSNTCPKIQGKVIAPALLPTKNQLVIFPVIFKRRSQKERVFGKIGAKKAPTPAELNRRT